MFKKKWIKKKILKKKYEKVYFDQILELGLEVEPSRDAELGLDVRWSTRVLKGILEKSKKKYFNFNYTGIHQVCEISLFRWTWI